MSTVRAKKHLGQHFLNDKNAAQKIVEALDPKLGFSQVLEVVQEWVYFLIFSCKRGI
jgi:16S rRNA (adenine1518-N6/adenine1519-N6)-dimethyltransferase